MAKDEQGAGSARSRYEYRVWGEHRRARKLLARLADSETTEVVEDCYLLADDMSWNAKVRDDTLKIKQLVSEHKGFERWRSERHTSSDSAPSPFDELFETLRLDRPQRGKPFDIEKAVQRIDPDCGIRAVFVTKRRRRYRVDGMKAEVTDIEVRDSGEVLRTLSIEGEDLDQLRGLRKALGLRDHPNIAVHQFIDAL